MAEHLATGESRFRPVLVLVLVGISLFLSVFFFLSREASSHKSEIDRSESASQATLSPALQEDKPLVSRYDFRLSGAQTFYQIMSILNVPGPDIHEIVLRARNIYDLRRLKQDTVLKVFTENEILKKIEYRFSDYETMVVERGADGVFNISKSELPHDTRETVVAGTIESSLYEDGLKAGADAQAIMAITDIFAWDIDFASDIRKGDSFKILTETLYVDGAPVKTGRILGAEMVNDGRRYAAIWFEGADGGAYYDADGRSLRRTLLKSPLRFRRITSHFSRGRFHPILKKFRPHHGVDYAAPVGTPIESAGSGRVVYAGWKGGYGNFVEIRHSNGFLTAYGHLSRIAKGINTGSKVDQGGVIGYVGSTGISTGPHLHYEVKVNGRLINPLSIKTIPGRPIAKKEMQRFASVRDEAGRKLSGSQEMLASSGPSPR